ncbi:SpoIID/LytB domain-containing protein [Litchfieldia alkalitelluris]|uniref:SpoIID/LytB domain-containing protein n=1 Tax=Litchfieldia alkalitelluris TaxID=304268 RepID=UPI001F29B270|nr:SpoIID/LytB domain-containing protein [Litchfieldia alkalitelluris]
MVKVKLVKDLGETNEITFKIHGEYLTLDESISIKEGEEYRLVLKRGIFYLKSKHEEQQINGSFQLIPNVYDTEHYITINDKPYLGVVEFLQEKNSYIRPVNQLPLEDYLKGVVPFEVFPAWSLESLKAQALAARTYAFIQMNQDMDDTIKYQVYGGFSWDKKTTQAVEETKGEIITFENKPIPAFYSASNGGITESNANVWGGDPKVYYPVKIDPFDPVQPWEFMLHRNQLQIEGIDWDHPTAWDDLVEMDDRIAGTMKSYLKKNGYLGEIKIVGITHLAIDEDTNASGRTKKGSVTVEFFHRLFDGTIMLEQFKLEDVNINKIRPMIGGDIFRSYLVDSLEEKDDFYIMKGRGYGHGVGMSQWGASVMGERGKSYKAILQHYFPETEIMEIGEIK